MLSRVETEADEKWKLPPAIRRSILAHHTRAGIDPSQRLSFLAHNRLDKGHHASALDYAVEAQNWTLAVDIVEQHWVTMIVHNLDSVRSALQRIPAEAADKHSAVEAGRALFTMHPSERSTVVDLLPESPAELWALGAEAGAKDALSIACVQSIMLRMAGEYGLAAETTRRLSHLSRSALENNPEAVSAQLPLMRLQWAINFQLSGRFTESTIKARMAYHGALSHGVDFIARNSAGSAALNWALAGEPRQATHWSELEQKHPDPGGWLEPVVKIAGLTARALTALDTLDFDDARLALTELGLPSDTEELWAFVVYAHCQFALTSGDHTAALLLLHNAIEAHSKQYTATSFALPLLQSAEIDLLLALGRGKQGRTALAKEIMLILQPTRGRSRRWHVCVSGSARTSPRWRCVTSSTGLAYPIRGHRWNRFWCKRLHTPSWVSHASPLRSGPERAASRIRPDFYVRSRPSHRRTSRNSNRWPKRNRVHSPNSRKGLLRNHFRNSYISWS